VSAIDSKIWIGQNGQKYGPYSGASVRQWFAEGKLAASTMAWRSGMSEWVTLATMIHAMAIDEPLPRPSLPPQDEAPPPPFLMTAALPPAAVAQVHSVTEEAQPPQRPQNAPSPLPVAPIAQTPSSPTAPWVHSTTTPLVDLSPKDYARKHMPSAKRSHSGRWAVGLVLVLIASGALAWTYLPHENLVTNLIQGYGFVSDPSGSSQTASDSSSRNAGLEVGRNGFMQPIGGMTLLQKSSVTFRLGTGAKKSSSGFHSDGIVLIRDGKMGVCFRSDSKQPDLCDYG
jgi:hypothetical protein